jgi:hypothetical protein
MRVKNGGEDQKRLRKGRKGLRDEHTKETIPC